jgi:hypothetical protein
MFLYLDFSFPLLGERSFIFVCTTMHYFFTSWKYGSYYMVTRYALRWFCEINYLFVHTFFLIRYALHASFCVLHVSETCTAYTLVSHCTYLLCELHVIASWTACMFVLYCIYLHCVLHPDHVCTAYSLVLHCSCCPLIIILLFLQKIPHRAIRYLDLRKAGVLQVVSGEGHPKPAEYRVGVDGRVYLQKGWKEFIIESGLESQQVVVLNFLKLGIVCLKSRLTWLVKIWGGL